MTTFDDVLKKFYFDTVLHDNDSLMLLLNRVGADRCLFGTERPGSGGGLDLITGRPTDDFKFKIDRLNQLTEADRRSVYELNARRIFTRLRADPE